MDALSSVTWLFSNIYQAVVQAKGQRRKVEIVKLLRSKSLLLRRLKYNSLTILKSSLKTRSWGQDLCSLWRSPWPTMEAPVSGFLPQDTCSTRMSYSQKPLIIAHTVLWLDAQCSLLRNPECFQSAFLHCPALSVVKRLTTPLIQGIEAWSRGSYNSNLTLPSDALSQFHQTPLQGGSLTAKHSRC